MKGRFGSKPSRRHAAGNFRVAPPCRACVSGNAWQHRMTEREEPRTGWFCTRLGPAGSTQLRVVPMKKQDGRGAPTHIVALAAVAFFFLFFPTDGSSGSGKQSEEVVTHKLPTKCLTRENTFCWDPPQAENMKTQGDSQEKTHEFITRSIS